VEFIGDLLDLRCIDSTVRVRQRARARTFRSRPMSTHRRNVPPRVRWSGNAIVVDNIRDTSGGYGNRRTYRCTCYDMYTITMTTGRVKPLTRRSRAEHKFVVSCRKCVGTIVQKDEPNLTDFQVLRNVWTYDDESSSFEEKKTKPIWLNVQSNRTGHLESRFVWIKRKSYRQQRYGFRVQWKRSTTSVKLALYSLNIRVYDMTSRYLSVKMRFQTKRYLSNRIVCAFVERTIILLRLKF